MAGEQAMASATGSPVDWSLGTALGAGDSRLEQLRSDGQRIGAVLSVTTQDAVRLGSEFKNSQERAAQSAQDWLTVLGRIYNNLHGQIEAVNVLTGLYRKLGEAMMSAQLPASGLSSQDDLAKVIDAAGPVLGKAGQALGDSNNYQQILNDITIKANLLVPQFAPDRSPEQAEEERQKSIASVPSIIATISDQSGMNKAEAAGLTRDMLDAGVDFSALKDLAPLAAKFSVGQNVDAKDTAALFRTMQNNGVAPGDMEKVLNAWIDQARNGGRVGVGDLTQMMPRLGAALAASGQQGADALIRAGQMVQARGQLLGSPIQISADVQAAIADQQMPALQPRTSSFNYVDEELKQRRQDPAQRQKEMENSFSNLSTSIGDSLQPVLAPFVTGITELTNGFTRLADANQGVVGTVATLGVAIAGALTILGGLRKGKELLDASKGVFGKKGEEGERGGVLARLMGTATGGKSAGVTLVHVTNMPRNFASRGGPGPGRSLAGGRQSGADYRPLGSDYRTPVTGPYRSAVEKSPKVATPAPRQDYAVTPFAAGPAFDTPPSASRQPVSGATSSALSPGSVGGQRAPGLFSRLGAAAGKTARKLLPGGRFVDAGLTVVDLFRSNTTRNEKIQGLSTAAGGLGGTMAGAAAGAALGSVVPVVGTVLGGLIGGMLGGMAGEAVGDRAGKALQGKSAQPSRPGRRRGGAAGEFAGDLASAVIIGAVATQMAPDPQPQASATLPDDARPPATEEGGTMLKSSMTNTSTANFAVTPAININVQGIITNPTELVSVLRPEVERMFANLAARASTGTEMFDLPGPPPTLITA